MNSVLTDTGQKSGLIIKKIHQVTDGLDKISDTMDGLRKLGKALSEAAEETRSAIDA